MNSQRFDSLQNMIAVIGSVIFLTCLPVFLYLVLLFAANDTGGPLNLILIPCANLIVAILFTVIFSYPLSRLLDWLIRKGNQNRQRKTMLLIGFAVFGSLGWILACGGFALAMGVILKNPVVLQILDPQVDPVMTGLLRVLLYGGLPILLGGTVYWFLLQASRKIVSNTDNEQELPEYPNAG